MSKICSANGITLTCDPDGDCRKVQIDGIDGISDSPVPVVLFTSTLSYCLKNAMRQTCAETETPALIVLHGIREIDGCRHEYGFETAIPYTTAMYDALVACVTDCPVE